MRSLKRLFVSGMMGLLCLSPLPVAVVWAQDAPSSDAPSKGSDRYTELGAELPIAMTLDDVLDRAGKSPPDEYPDSIPDDQLRAFLLVDQFEYRYNLRDEPDHAGTEFTAWFGGDYNRLWLKGEGEAGWQGDAGFEGESQTDLLYGRLFSAFWTAQIGAQYANAWGGGDYQDYWAAALAIQGLAPGMFEIDASLYITENRNLLASFEAEYDFRLTQRLVLQPRTELRFSAQDIEARGVGIGLNSVVADLRLRYAFLRELGPYLGARYEGLLFGSGDMAEAAGADCHRVFLIGGVRFALY